MIPIVRDIVQRMSLRKPQIHALEAFVRATNLITMTKSVSLEESLKPLQTVFPLVTDFERSFPNLCFSLATGVGKTRLMGAMIAYLALHRGVRDFVILAPNNTIEDKLKREFENSNHPKYVFRGIAAFNQPPKVITNENFDEGQGVRNEWLTEPTFFDTDQIFINIFNIAMIHSDKRRMKKPRETIRGCLSYFDYLSQIDNLVVFMDEAHRYRATAALKAIDELNPILGVELTATPHIEKDKTTLWFKNILYNYPLSAALNDQFVKEPAVVGRENFKASSLQNEALEKLKLEDGVRCHEATKLHLHNFVNEERITPVKPFMLVITESKTHAARIEEMIKSDTFFDGFYKNKVRVVHSDRDDEEQMVKDLLEIESPDNPIEIVIHVDMLKEGWDVVNLYTIVPLRKANSKTLIEQSIGRGLRLPFEKRTGIKEIDELKIISHDRFDEIINEAKNPKSIIRVGYLIGQDLPIEGFQNIESKPAIYKEIAGYSLEEKIIAEKTLEFIEQNGTQPSSSHIQKIKNALNIELDHASVEQSVQEFLKKHDELSIRIPRVTIEPEVVQPCRYLPFKLDFQGIHPQSIDQNILVQSLQDGSRRTVEAACIYDGEETPENIIIKDLLDVDEVANNEENLSVIRDLAKQLIAYLSSYLKAPDEILNVIMTQRAALINHIRSQLQFHFEPPVFRFAPVIGRHYTILKNTYLTIPADQKPIPFNEVSGEMNLPIGKYVFCGYKKSQYSLNKFQSHAERLFATVLETDNDVLKWIKPPRKSLSLFYAKDHQYEPDFIVETHKCMYLCEIKSSAELDDPIVQSKADAAVVWCQHATVANQNDGKPWAYLLVPHNAVTLSSTVNGLAQQFTLIKPKSASTFESDCIHHENHTKVC